MMEQISSCRKVSKRHRDGGGEKEKQVETERETYR